MKQKIITINGMNYPVVFSLLTMSNFEEITDKGFFEANMNKTNVRMALIIAAAMAADKDCTLTFEDLRGADSYDDLRQIVDAYNAVMTLANDFFEIPAIEKGKDAKPSDEEKKEGHVKN